MEECVVFACFEEPNHRHTVAVQKSVEGDSRSAIVQVDDECIVAKLLKCLIMVTIHVACSGTEREITQT